MVGMVGMCLKQSDGEVHAHRRQDPSFFYSYFYSISISIHSSNLNSHLRRYSHFYLHNHYSVNQRSSTMYYVLCIILVAETERMIPYVFRTQSGRGLLLLPCRISTPHRRLDRLMALPGTAD